MECASWVLGDAEEAAAPGPFGGDTFAAPGPFGGDAPAPPGPVDGDAPRRKLSKESDESTAGSETWRMNLPSPPGGQRSTPPQSEALMWSGAAAPSIPEVPAVQQIYDL